MQSTTSRAERYAWPGRLCLCLCCCASSDPEPVPSKVQEAERLLLKQTPLLHRRSTGQPDTGPTMLCRSWRSGTTPQSAASSSLTKTCSQSIGARNGVRTRRISSRGSGGSWRWLAYRRHLDFASSDSRCSANCAVAGTQSLAGARRGAGNGSSQAEDEPAGSCGAGVSSNSRAAGSGKAWGGAAAEADSTEVLGPEVPCPDETAIFQELGLSYVPPHMRFFS